MCHTPAPQEDRGAQILREPKGRPDLILVARGKSGETLFKAAAILGVQGYTARLVALFDEALFMRQPLDFRESILPRDKSETTVFEAETPQETARCAREAIRRVHAL